jgi:hypothetical protein
MEMLNIEIISSFLNVGICCDNTDKKKQSIIVKNNNVEKEIENMMNIKRNNKNNRKAV